MWPNLFGPGWVLTAFAALGVLVVIGVLTLALKALVAKQNPAAGVPPDQNLLHRYEEGDLTSAEFARLRKQRKAA